MALKSKLHAVEPRASYQRGCYLFLSFDLVNSTELKGREPRWPLVMHYFYVETLAVVHEISASFHVWKYIGDEVVFWRFIAPGEHLPALVSRIHAALRTIRDRLDGLQEKYGVHTRNLLGVKGTLWVASAEFVASDQLEKHLEIELPHMNRILEERVALATDRPSAHSRRRTVDFIGPEIDIGFRLAKFAHNGFLLLNAPLTALLLRQVEESSLPARVVSLEPLKGVWGGRPYPIVWYSDPWEHPEEKFAYDELIQQPIVARVVAGVVQPLRLVNKVLSDLNLDGQVAHLAEQLGL